jgi:hypothetical protein
VAENIHWESDPKTLTTVFAYLGAAAEPRRIKGLVG